MLDPRYQDIRHYASRLISRYSDRDNMLQDLRRMFHMNWVNVPKGDWIKPTMSPSAYNATIGAIRLLTAAEPQLSVPFDEVDASARGASEKIESAARAMWSGSGRVALRPVHYEAVFSAVLFGEICATVTKTADLASYAEKSGNRAAAARMRYVASETPYLFQVWNPETCYPDFDHFGLRAMLRRTKTTWGEVHDAWGALAENAYSGHHERDEVMTLNDWYDWEHRAVWLDSSGYSISAMTNTAGQTPGVRGAFSDTPILFEPHGLDFLPVVAQISEGSFLFDKPEEQRLPLLYAVWKSGLWKRENLSLTILFSLIFALGSNPVLVRKTSQPGSPLIIDRSMPGGVVDIAPDESIVPLIEKVLDPSQLTALDLASRLNTESTIPKMALGSPPTQAMPFSAISLLSQSGRLPLVAPKELGGAAISNMLITALRWLKQDGRAEKFYRRGLVVELDPAEIPDRIVIECNLEPSLPQDKMQLASIAQLITGSSLASKRWARENVLNIGQSRAMDKEIWMEQRIQFELTRLLQRLQAEDQMEMQMEAAERQQEMAAEQQAQQQAAMAAQQQAQAAQQQPGAGGMPQGEEGMTPEQMAESMGEEGAYPIGGQVGPGMPMQGPVPQRPGGA